MEVFVEYAIKLILWNDFTRETLVMSVEKG